MNHVVRRPRLFDAMRGPAWVGEEHLADLHIGHLRVRPAPPQAGRVPGGQPLHGHAPAGRTSRTSPRASVSTWQQAVSSARSRVRARWTRDFIPGTDRPSR
ncbi:hypothetical protein, partial [Planomonospora algeriensis]